jgi:hypothetical protein
MPITATNPFRGRKERDTREALLTDPQRSIAPTVALSKLRNETPLRLHKSRPPCGGLTLEHCAFGEPGYRFTKLPVQVGIVSFVTWL